MIAVATMSTARTGSSKGRERLGPKSYGLRPVTAPPEPVMTRICRTLWMLALLIVLSQVVLTGFAARVAERTLRHTRFNRPTMGGTRCGSTRDADSLRR